MRMKTRVAQGVFHRHRAVCQRCAEVLAVPLHSKYPKVPISGPWNSSAEKGLFALAVKDIHEQEVDGVEAMEMEEEAEERDGEKKEQSERKRTKMKKNILNRIFQSYRRKPEVCRMFWLSSFTLKYPRDSISGTWKP